MRLAASRAVAVETPRGWRLGKQQRRHKIDLIVALAMSAWAAVQGQSEPSVVTPADPAWDLAWGMGDAHRRECLISNEVDDSLCPDRGHISVPLPFADRLKLAA
jgi:hypothetical protein